MTGMNGKVFRKAEVLIDRMNIPLMFQTDSIPYSSGGHTPEERRILSMAYITLLIKEVIL